jgi:signal transduction histidine kinase
MNWRDLSIVRKLGLLLAVNTVLAVFAIATVFAVGTAVSRYQDMREHLEALAQVVGESSRAALAFNDPRVGRSLIQALAVKEEIDLVRILDSTGAVFAFEDFSDRREAHHSTLEMLVERVLASDVQVTFDIVDEGQVLGRVVMQAHLLHMWMQLLGSLGLMALIGVVLAALALFYGMRLRRIVTDPILSLAQVTDRVTRQQDYGIRAVKSGNDEIGSLVDHFNRMLGEIQSRDEALQRERASLQQRTLEMKQAMEQAERANRVKSEFLSTVSHELRTPLTSLSGSIALIQGGALGELPAPVTDLLRIAHKNSLRLGHLINDLLDMDKLVAGKLRFELQVQPLMPLVEQAMDGIQAYAQPYRVRVELLQRLDGARVRVDGQRLQQVLANLLSNAVKFSPADGVVEVAVQDLGECIRVAVTDHGPGVPESFRGRIFQKFSQADASDTRQRGGTGLGLAISRELIERMGGHIGFDSVEGRGASFFFDLPLAPAAREHGAST